MTLQSFSRGWVFSYYPLSNISTPALVSIIDYESNKTQTVARKITKIFSNMFNIIELKFRKSGTHFLFEKVLSKEKQKDGRFYIVPHFLLLH